MTGRQRKLCAWSMAVLAAIALYALLGFFLIPHLVRKQLVQRGSEALQREVSLEKMAFNPFTFTAELREIRIAGKHEEPLATIEAATLNFNPLNSLVMGQWQFGHATIASADVRLIIDEHGNFNLSELVQPSDEKEGPPIGIDRLAISKARLTFIDRSRAEPFRTKLAPVDFVLTDFSTEPDEFGNYRLTGTTANDRPFSWRGTLAMGPFTSRGHMAFDSLNLVTYTPLLAGYFSADLRSGHLTLNGDYNVSLGDNRHAILTDFTLQGTNLVVALPEAENPLLELPSATIEVRQAQLLQGSAQLSRVALEGAVLRVERQSGGSFNVTQLFPEEKGEAESDEPEEGDAGFDVQIDQIAVNGTIKYVDHTLAESFVTTLQPFDLTVSGLTTASGSANDGSYRLTGETETGAAFALDGTLGLSPFTSRGTLSLERITLPVYRPYFADVWNGELRSGQVALQGRYDVSFGEDRRHATLTDTTVRGSDIALALPEAESPAIELPAITVDLSQAQLLDFSAQVARLVLEDPFVRVERDTDRTLDLTRLLASGTSADGDTAESDQAESDEPGGSGTPVQVEKLIVQNGAVEFIDHTTPELARLRAEQIQLTAADVSTDPNMEIGVDLAFQWAEGPGTVAATGNVKLQPLSTSLGISAENIALTPAAPYLQQVIAARLLSGRASLKGGIRALQAGDGPVAFHWEGQAVIEDLDLRDAVHGHELLRWRQVGLNNSVFTSEPRSFVAREVTLRGVALHVIRLEDGAINVTQILKDDSASRETGDSEQSEDSLPITAAIESLVIDQGGVVFQDRAIEPEFNTALTSIEGAVMGLSTAPDSSAQVDLTGTLAGAAPLSMSGRVNLLAADILAGTRITADLSNLPVDHFEPYAERYLGYKIERGRLRGDFAYTITEDTLDGSNRLVLDEFALGESVESPDAVSGPVKLGIAVLRNRQGEVELNVPVSGSLESPNFSFGSVIRRAFSNVFSKVVTAPFSMLASLFGSGKEDLSQAEFLPGEALLQEATKERIDILARALKERPGLALVINWRPMESVDREVLKEKRLQQLIQEKREEIAGGPLTPQNQVGEAEALQALARERFPEIAGEVATDETRGGRRWYQRLLDSIFGRDLAGPSDGDSPSEELAELRQMLLESLSLDRSEYRELARARAVTAREHLIAADVDPHRVSVAPHALQQDEPKDTDRALIHFELQEAPPEPAATRARG